MGPWVAAARAQASNDAEAAENEWNLRTQARPTAYEPGNCAALWPRDAALVVQNVTL